MGCMHSLQPTAPYETPSIPCLKPLGYLRWQTIQLLLDPAEHAPFLQQAVRLYDVPMPDGGIFPNRIPAEAFPSQPDKDIEDWWRSVSYSMNQENHMRKLGNSPYLSPYENGNRNEYFVQPGRLSASAAQRPHRPSRHNSEGRTADTRRRSSVPDLVFNQNGDGRPDSKKNSSRSRSAQRVSSGPHNHPPPPHLPGPQRHPTSAHRHSNASSPYRPSTNGSNDPNGHRRHRSSGEPSTPRRRNRSPSTINESTGSEASSEDSQYARDAKKLEGRRRSSLWPPSFLQHHRRHSHDATYDVSERAPPLPPRPTPIQTHVPRTEFHPASPQSANRRRGASNLSNVQFRDDIFTHEQATSSAPETPVAPEYTSNQMPVPRTRQEPPPPPPPQNMHLLQGAPLSRATSMETSREDQTRNFKPPARSKTVTMGVGGRKYPAGEPRGTGLPSRRKDRTLSETPTGSSQSG